MLLVCCLHSGTRLPRRLLSLLSCWWCLCGSRAIILNGGTCVACLLDHSSTRLPRRLLSLIAAFAVRRCCFTVCLSCVATPQVVGAVVVLLCMCFFLVSRLQVALATPVAGRGDCVPLRVLLRGFVSLPALAPQRLTRSAVSVAVQRLHRAIPQGTLADPCLLGTRLGTRRRDRRSCTAVTCPRRR